MDFVGNGVSGAVSGVNGRRAAVVVGGERGEVLCCVV